MGAWHYENKIGNRYGKLEVISETTALKRNDGKRQIRWLCKCDCGKISIVRSECLSRGTTTSCGCKKGEQHGCTKTNLYKIWLSMIQRCEDKNCRSYHRYGGRGISVCNKWRRSFLTFKTDMGKRPLKYTLERIKNSGDYEPRNCKWATRKEQARNTRRNRIITFNGRSMCIRQWEDNLGLNRNVLWDRLKSGWSIKKSITTPQMKGNIK